MSYNDFLGCTLMIYAIFIYARRYFRNGYQPVGGAVVIALASISTALLVLGYSDAGFIFEILAIVVMYILLYGQKTWEKKMKMRN